MDADAAPTCSSSGRSNDSSRDENRTARGRVGRVVAVVIFAARNDATVRFARVVNDATGQQRDVRCDDERSWRNDDDNDDDAAERYLAARVPVSCAARQSTPRGVVCCAGEIDTRTRDRPLAFTSVTGDAKGLPLEKTPNFVQLQKKKQYIYFKLFKHPKHPPWLRYLVFWSERLIRFNFWVIVSSVPKFVSWS